MERGLTAELDQAIDIRIGSVSVGPVDDGDGARRISQLISFCSNRLRRSGYHCVTTRWLIAVTSQTGVLDLDGWRI